MNQTKPWLGVDVRLPELLSRYGGRDDSFSFISNQLADCFDLCWYGPETAPVLNRLAGLIYVERSPHDEVQGPVPLLPYMKWGGLDDQRQCENFFERVFAYQRWHLMLGDRADCQAFIEFHRRHKLMLMARGQVYYRELGRMVAGVTAQTLTDRRSAYIARFMQVMAQLSARGQHVNVLQHILGYFKHLLSGDEKRFLLAEFEAYRDGHSTLSSSLALIRELLPRHPQDYIADQHYLEPFPSALRAFSQQ